MAVVKRFDVVWVNLDPTVGKEIKKTRPAVVISPDEMNKYLDTIIIAPITSTIRNYPTRINCFIKNKEGQVVLDQIRAIDKFRVTGHICPLDKQCYTKVIECLLEMFSM
jgi:mRNA interferase MazF